MSMGAAVLWLAVPEGVYFPSLVEIVAVIGMVAFGILIYRLLTLVFKVE
jgi:Ni/Fe-hydrogenase subunit HybB-like protein